MTPLLCKFRADYMICRLRSLFIEIKIHIIIPIRILLESVKLVV